MPSWDGNDLRYLTSRGHNPRDICRFLRSPDDFSSYGFASLLHGIARDDVTEDDETALRELLGHSNSDICGPALGLLVGLLGTAAAPACRECLMDPSYANKPAAMTGLTEVGLTDDAEQIVRYAKRHLTGRKRKWEGATPIVEAIGFLEKHASLGEMLRDLSEWTAKRWPLLSAGERKRLAPHSPQYDHSPPRIVICGGTDALREMVADAAISARPAVKWLTIRDASQLTTLSGGHCVLAIDGVANTIASSGWQTQPVSDQHGFRRSETFNSGVCG